MHISVITLSDTSLIFNVNSFDKIKSLKQKIHEKINFDVVNQSLVFANVELNDDNTFSDYNIIDGCVIKSQMSIKYQKELFNASKNPFGNPFDNQNKYQTNLNNGWLSYQQGQRREFDPILPGILQTQKDGFGPILPSIPYKEPGMGHTPF